MTQRGGTRWSVETLKEGLLCPRRCMRQVAGRTPEQVFIKTAKVWGPLLLTLFPFFFDSTLSFRRKYLACTAASFVLFFPRISDQIPRTRHMMEQIKDIPDSSHFLLFEGSKIKTDFGYQFCNIILWIRNADLRKDFYYGFILKQFNNCIKNN